MSFKTDKAVSILKKKLPMFIILWLFVAIVFVAPITYAYVNAVKVENLSIQILLDEFITAFLKFTTITNMFEPQYMSTFRIILLIFTIMYIYLVYQGIKKQIPKSEYDKKEHGSSDWCEEGEQYKILSKDSGLILADKNCLPLTKRGNLNVLIVGRIRNR